MGNIFRNLDVSSFCTKFLSHIIPYRLLHWKQREPTRRPRRHLSLWALGTPTPNFANENCYINIYLKLHKIKILKAFMLAQLLERRRLLFVNMLIYSRSNLLHRSAFLQISTYHLRWSGRV